MDTRMRTGFLGKTVLALLQLATLGWLWFNRKPPESSVPVSLTLATDLILIGLWLFYTGGYTNPLVSVLLLPIAVAIILVPTRQSIALTLTGITVYTARRSQDRPTGNPASR